MDSDVVFDDFDVGIVRVGDVRAQKFTVLSLQSIDGLICSSQGILRIMV